MKTTCTLLLTLFVACAISFEASAQSNFWTVNNESRGAIPTDKAVARQSFPKEFKLFNLNIEPLRQQLFAIVGSNTPPHSTVIVLPNADGALRTPVDILTLRISNRPYRHNFLRSGLIPAKALQIGMQR